MYFFVFSVSLCTFLCIHCVFAFRKGVAVDKSYRTGQTGEGDAEPLAGVAKEMGMYQNGGKHPLHSPWRVKMRRCRLKNGQRVIFPASQENMEKFHEICEYDPNNAQPKYKIDINVPVMYIV